MRQLILLAAVTMGCSSVVGAPANTAATPIAAPSAGPPPWAFGFAGPAPAVGTVGAAAAVPAAGVGGGAGGRGAAPPPDTTKKTVMGSSQSFTLAQVRDTYGPADWFPGDHPAMPAIVAHGRREAQILACSLCHYPNGKGRAENAAVSGLPVEYFVKTMHDFKNDARKSSDARKANTNRMIAFAKAMTEEEIQATAEYFSAIKWTPWIKVVEADVVPKTRIAAGLFVALEGAQAGTEPIAGRIIEVPENAEQTETFRNPRSGFIAYAPTGSLARGESVATRGQCAACHGPALRGLGPVPGIAGRSPSYMVRQMYDMKSGARHGSWSDLMKPVVAAMSDADMLAVAAYVASRAP